MADEQPTAAQKIGGFAVDAGVDVTADSFINREIDSVASHIPGGALAETALKAGVDLEANRLINSEIGNVEGAFGKHEEPTQ